MKFVSNIIFGLLEEDVGKVEEGKSFIKMTGCLNLISICDMVYFLSLINYDKFQIIFNLNDVKVMTKKSIHLGEITRDSSDSCYSGKIVTGEHILAACE